MTYNAENKAKANFDGAYIAPTPHAYVNKMAESGYEIGEQCRPYGVAAVELLRKHNGAIWPVQMLDLGCSYGMGATFVRHGCSFDEVVAFFSSRAPTEYRACCETTRMWLNVTSPACDVRSVGLDSSRPAIRFALDTGLLDGGIARDFEQPGSQPTDEERAWFRSCNLLISTGAVGYVTERTLKVVLKELGKEHPADIGPFAVISILRMFDDDPIQAVFEGNGLKFGRVPGVRLPQRRFTDDTERHSMLRVLHDRGLDTQDWEDRGKLFADLFIAAPEKQFALLLERMTTVEPSRPRVPEPALAAGA